MIEEDLDQVYALWQSFAMLFDFFPIFSLNYFKKLIKPEFDFINTYVSYNAKGLITDFISFYRLESTVMNNSHTKLEAAYCFYYYSRSIKVLKDLFHEVLYFCREMQVDVFNCMDIMQNKIIICDLKFIQGDGILKYHLFNWKSHKILPENIGIVIY